MLAVFSDERCERHQPPPGFPETPARRSAILGHFRARGIVVRNSNTAADVRGIASRTHDHDYLRRFERAVERGDGLLDSADNPLSAGTGEAAWGAVEAAVSASDWIMAGPDRQALVVVRPPGHHAGRATAMGFCYLNTIAIAAQYLLDRYSLDRAAIVDFDVHHGNGTQDIFYSRADVLFVSLHQFPFYPGTGTVDETGAGEGLGKTLNVPLAAGQGDIEYLRRFDDVVIPALATFAPDVILVSAGFDAWRNDPLGGMRVTEQGFGRWGQKLRQSASELCDGRMISLLEGGYDVASLPLLAASYVGLE